MCEVKKVNRQNSANIRALWRRVCALEEFQRQRMIESEKGIAYTDSERASTPQSECGNGSPRNGDEVLDGSPRNGDEVFDGSPQNGNEEFDGSPQNVTEVFDGSPQNGNEELDARTEWMEEGGVGGLRRRDWRSTQG